MEIDIYRKESFTGQYTRFDSFEPWSYKTGWVRSLFDRTKRICSTSDGFHKQKRFLNELLSWNAFPKFVRAALMRKFDKPAIAKDTIIYDHTVYNS